MNNGVDSWDALPPPILFLSCLYPTAIADLPCCSTLTLAQVVRIGWRLRLARFVPCLLPGLQCNKRRVLVANYDTGTSRLDAADACLSYTCWNDATELICGAVVVEDVIRRNYFLPKINIFY